MNYEELERRMYAAGETDTLAYQAVLACTEAEDALDESAETEAALQDDVDRLTLECDELREQFAEDASLIEFARDVLARLEADEEWNADTLDTIGRYARDYGFFRILD